jgi:hypothetical protein
VFKRVLSYRGFLGSNGGLIGVQWGFNRGVIGV